MYTLKQVFKFTALIALLIVTIFSFSATASAANSKATGFKWVYEYFASSNTGVLTITIYEENKSTNYTYTSACSTQSDHVACDVNIQDAANQAYASSGLNESVPKTEMYPAIFAEATGEFSQMGIDANLVSHPSIQFDIATGKTRRKAQFSTDWSGIQANSKWFGYKNHKARQMTTAFDSGEFVHAVNTTPINRTLTGTAQLPFQLDGTTFRIYDVKGFDLHKFIVDPVKNGFG